MSIKSVETAFLAFLRSFYVFSHWQHQLFLYLGIYSGAGEVALPAAGAGRKSAQVLGTCISILQCGGSVSSAIVTMAPWPRDGHQVTALATATSPRLAVPRVTPPSRSELCTIHTIQYNNTIIQERERCCSIAQYAVTAPLVRSGASTVQGAAQLGSMVQ